MRFKALVVGAAALGIATSAPAEDRTLTLSVHSFGQAK